MNSELSQALLDAFRSQEEKMFGFWLREAVEAKLIIGFEYEKDVFELAAARKVTERVQLKTKEVMKDRHIHRSESYTPDFRIRFTDAGEKIFKDVFPKAFAIRRTELTPHDLFVDVKGGFNPYQTDERYFSLVRKIVLARHGLWVEKVEPKKLFLKTWCPEEYRWMKKRKEPTLTKLGHDSPTISGFILTHGGEIDSTGVIHTQEQPELF